MSAHKLLGEVFSVEDRFRRSVNLTADYRRNRALYGYVVTPLVGGVLERIGAGLGQGALNRAWSITGPYGTGKSACAVFIGQVLGYPINDAARDLLRSGIPDVARGLFSSVPGLEEGGFLIVPVVGSRQPLARTLLRGLAEAMEGLAVRTPALEEQHRRVVALYERSERGEDIASPEVTEAVERTAAMARREVPGVLGLLLMVDELGKALEYAALHPGGTDVGLLQTLAETAARSHDPAIGLVTILHQAFEHYADRLGPLERREWAKVQGRFEDLAFQQSGGELLSLIGRAIRPQEMDRTLRAAIEEEVEEARRLGVLPNDLDSPAAMEALQRCAPLHPSVALVLGRLFRSRLAQNERSLFAFLSSGEPYGFQEYLGTEVWGENGRRPFYRLDRLYDYVQTALGSGLYVSAQGKRWAEIEEALERLPAGGEALDARLVKTIGLLGLVGDQRQLKASGDVLAYALADGETSLQDVRAALGRVARRKIAIHRRFSGAYSLWQGSDVDLDECYERGRAQTQDLDLATGLARYGRLTPYVAKRHLHETGTFRYLAPWVVDLAQVAGVAERPLGEADGAVVFVVPPAEVTPEEAAGKVAEFSRGLGWPRCDQFFFAIPRDMHGVREGLREVAAWEWVVSNIAELEGDRVARLELRARQRAAREGLGRALSRCFDLAFCYESALWVRGGRIVEFGSARELAAALSGACDEVYGAAPIAKNELLNRRSLSSAAAGARRSLIEAMLEHGGEERLGLAERYPPEVSMYLSILKESGLHQKQGDGWVFGRPEGDDPRRVGPLWERMGAFLAETEGAAQPVTAL